LEEVGSEGGHLSLIEMITTARFSDPPRSVGEDSRRVSDVHVISAFRRSIDHCVNLSQEHDVHARAVEA
jgi:hypothetical protein